MTGRCRSVVGSRELLREEGEFRPGPRAIATGLLADDRGRRRAVRVHSLRRGHGRLAPVRRHVELRLAHQRPSTAASPTEAATSSASTSSAPRTSGSLDGAWTVGSGSTVGYRVHETLFGQSDAVVGRTSAIIGSLTVSGGTLTTGSFSADLTSSPVTAHLHPDEFRFVEMIRPESLIIEQF